MKKKVLIYSDGLLFGGSEYVVANILKNSYLNQKYDFIFAYRYHKDYQQHVESLFAKGDRVNFYPLHVWALDNLYFRVDGFVKNTLLKKIALGCIAIFSRIQVCNIYNYFVLKRFIKSLQVDIIHINNGGFPGAESCLVLAKIANEMGFKVVMQINNIPTTSKRFWDPIIKKSVDSFIIASKFTSGRIIKIRDITNDNNVFTLRDNVKYEAPKVEAQSLREKMGISNNSIVLIQVALLLLYKGQIHILEALIQMREKNKELYERIVLILIGSGEMEETLRIFVKDNQLDNHVIFLGYRNDYIDYLNMADVLVHPSRANEDMPLIIMSAMSLGKPVISCNFAGIPEEVEHMKSGILLNPESPTFVDDLASSIPIAYDNRESFGRRGREIYESEFSEEQYEKGLDEIYQSVLNHS